MNLFSRNFKFFVFGINFLFAFCTYAEEVPTQIYLKPTQINFQVNLPEKPSSGYHWKIKNIDEKYLRVIKREYNPPRESSVFSEVGNVQFTFAVTYRNEMPKFTIVVFTYGTEDQLDSQKQEHTMTVSFQESVPKE